MAFLYPKSFPALCVTETDSDPKDIRITGSQIQIYPVGMTLEQAMALVWRPKQFNIQSSYVVGTDCGFLGGCSYRTGSINGTSDDSNDQARLTKMSDLICLESYNPEYARLGEGDSYVDCNDNTEPPYEILSYLNIVINKGFSTFDLPIYFFEDKYYVAMFYGAMLNGVGNLIEDGGRTSNVGNFTIKINGVDDIIFPIYFQPATGDCDQPFATATFTMTEERETS
jgi:hypothetical protein